MSPTPAPGRRPPSSVTRRPPRSNSGSATRKRPRFASTATSGPPGGRPLIAPACAVARAPSPRELRLQRAKRDRQCLVALRLRVVLRLHGGLDAVAGEVLALRQVVAADGQLHESVVGQRIDLLED